MSKYTEQIDALEAMRCKVCGGIGKLDLALSAWEHEEGDCPDCDGSGIVADPFEKYWDHLPNSSLIGTTKYDVAKRAFNAGRESMK